MKNEKRAAEQENKYCAFCGEKIYSKTFSACEKCLELAAVTKEQRAAVEMIEKIEEEGEGQWQR